MSNKITENKPEKRHGQLWCWSRLPLRWSYDKGRDREMLNSMITIEPPQCTLMLLASADELVGLQPRNLASWHPTSAGTAQRGQHSWWPCSGPH